MDITWMDIIGMLIYVLLMAIIAAKVIVWIGRWIIAFLLLIKEMRE